MCLEEINLITKKSRISAIFLEHVFALDLCYNTITLISNAILDPIFHRIGNTSFQFCVLKVCVKISKINEFQAYFIQSA